MGIFDLFRPTSDSNRQHEQKDERKAECPSCRKALSKVPGAKKKCPHCGQFMFVRTRPIDNTRVVVTKDEADRIDMIRSIVREEDRDVISAERKFANEEETLKKRFGGKVPSANDVRWSLLNKQLIKHAQKADWGLYSSARFQMAEILRREVKLEEALRTYLEVCYLDLNGPSNRGGVRNPKLLKEFPPFDPKHDSFLGPGIVVLVKRIALELKLSKDEIKRIFLEHNSRIRQSLKLPLSVERAWRSLDKELP